MFSDEKENPPASMGVLQNKEKSTMLGKELQEYDTSSSACAAVKPAVSQPAVSVSACDVDLSCGASSVRLT